MSPVTKMRIAQTVYLSTLAAALVGLSGCQKARMSSVTRQNPVVQPAVTPGAVYVPPRPGVVPVIPPPRPGVVPPGGIIPPPRPGIMPQQPPVVGQPTYPPVQTPPPTTVIVAPNTPTIPTNTRTPAPTTPTVVGTTNPPPTPVAQTTPVATQPVPSTTTPVTVTVPAPTPAPTPVPVAVPAPVATPAPVPVATTHPVPAVVQNGSQIFIQQAPMHGDMPVFLGDLRVITPNRGNVLATCRREECAPPSQVFQPDCRKGDAGCRIETIQEARKKPEVTCPDVELRQRPMTSKLDILFVIDTSASMKEERVEIARQMTNFIGELSQDVDYRITALLGHGPRSKAKGVDVGSLFFAETNINELVIQHDDIYSTVKHLGGIAEALRKQNPQVSDAEIEKAVRAKVAELISIKLEALMKVVPNDNSETEGEAGLLNLFTAMNDSRKRNDMQRAGFLRDDAALAVIFVADENDVCYDYAAESKRLGRTIKPNFADERLYRKTEMVAFDSGDVCRSTAGGQRLTPEHVFQALKAAKRDMPVILSGILYIDENIPQKNDRWSKDNEMGRGYLDLIGLGHGQAADLAKHDFGKSLAKIGDFSNFRMKYDHAFPMQNVRDVRDIDPETVRVIIVEANGEEHVFNAANVKLELDDARNTAKVVIAYETLAKVYADGKVSPGARISIRYSTKSEEAVPASTAVQAAPVSAPAATVEQGARESEVTTAPLQQAAPIEDRSTAAPKEEKSWWDNFTPTNPFGRDDTP